MSVILIIWPGPCSYFPFLVSMGFLGFRATSELSYYGKTPSVLMTGLKPNNGSLFNGNMFCRYFFGFFFYR
jgi:hypothetical protein